MANASVRMRADVSALTRYQLAVLGALAAFGVGCVIYVVEKFVLGLQHRFVENPSDIMVRAFALAHFFVAWLYLFTSPSIRSLPALARLAFWTATACLACYVFYLGGGAKNPFLVLAFYTLFLIHECNDQTDLFLLGAPDLDRPKLLGWLQASFILIFMTLLLAGNLIHALAVEYSPALEKIQPGFLALGLALLVTICLASTIYTLRLARSECGALAEMGRVYAPLLTIFFSIGGILLVGSFFGAFGFNFTVLVHVMTWLLFVNEQLAGKKQARPGAWNWLRGTAAGFLTLHLALIVGILVLLALRVHVWGKVGIVSQSLASSTFPYWSILHIVISYARK